MVDTTSIQNVPNQDIVAAENRICTNLTAEIWMSNIDALIKLWQKGTTLVSILPKGVFRCILDMQFPKESWRYSQPYFKFHGNKQDRHFPAFKRLSYDNNLVEIN